MADVAAVKLYPFQEKAVRNIEAGFKTHRIQCLSWYTGAGKTNVFIEICRRMINENPKAKIGISAYMTLEIKDQIADRLLDFGLGEHTHVVKAVSPKYIGEKNITVFNPQGIFRDIPDVKFDLLIIDESHAGTDESCSMLRKIIAKTTNQKSRILLVSATPWDTLALKDFSSARVLKRSLDQGLTDGLITDFKFNAEEASIEFTDDDFNRMGDLKVKKDMRRMTRIKSACMGKMDYLLKNYDVRLGKKVLVFCPPGNGCEIAFELAKKYKGLPFVQRSLHGGRIIREFMYNTEDNLDKFKTDPSIRFLFVTYKCQVGFDYDKLTSVIDLTMTRNIKLLAQRIGRIARKDGASNKNYFYVYDKSLMKNRLEWLILTMIDFSLGHYDGWTTKTSKWRNITVPKQFGRDYPISISVKEIIRALSDAGAIENKKTIKFVDALRPTHRTLGQAIEEMKEFSSRTEMWQKKPTLYKWFRLNAKAEMDKHFPLKHHLGKWTDETVLAVMKKYSKKMTREKFLDKFGGIEYWLCKGQSSRDPNRQEILDKYFPLMHPPWTDERILEALKSIYRWSDIRKNGLRSAMTKGKNAKGEHYWRNIWFKMRMTKQKTG